MKVGDRVRIIGSDRINSWRHLQYLNHHGVISVIVDAGVLVILDNPIHRCDEEGLWFYHEEVTWEDLRKTILD